MWPGSLCRWRSSSHLRPDRLRSDGEKRTLTTETTAATDEPHRPRQGIRYDGGKVTSNDRGIPEPLLPNTDHGSRKHSSQLDRHDTATGE